MSTWAAVALVGGGSYLLRLLPLLLVDRWPLSDSAQELLRAAGVAALAGLLVVSLAGTSGPAVVDPSTSLPLLAAGATAVAGGSLLRVVGVAAVVHLALVAGAGVLV
jgi:branched-subunit amino acid transport protein